jgi:hypothetical protein
MSSKSTTRLTLVSLTNTGPLKRIERLLYWIAIIAKVIVFLMFILLLLQIPTGGENLI